jgi:hypothetical protein
MQLIEVNIIRLQPAQAFLDGCNDIRFARVPVPAATIPPPLVTYLGGQYDSLSPADDRLAQQGFVEPMLI